MNALPKGTNYAMESFAFLLVGTTPFLRLAVFERFQMQKTSTIKTTFGKRSFICDVVLILKIEYTINVLNFRTLYFVLFWPNVCFYAVVS